MCYCKAESVLPTDLLKKIQEFIDGEYIYIPKKEANKKAWGSNTTTKQELKKRNMQIYRDYEDGLKINELADKYYLSSKSIQRIVYNEKK